MKNQAKLILAFVFMVGLVNSSIEKNDELNENHVISAEKLNN